ncbi:hypothetical protein BN1183_AC_00870 [Pantoea ananatis]|nr:hypothetical protein BN1183_AC_00870 [Pantoea ananatis]
MAVVRPGLRGLTVLLHQGSSEASLSCTWLLMAANRLSREIAAAAEKPARYRAQKSGKRLHS